MAPSGHRGARLNWPLVHQIDNRRLGGTNYLPHIHDLFSRRDKVYRQIAPDIRGRDSHR